MTGFIKLINRRRNVIVILVFLGCMYPAIKSTRSSDLMNTIHSFSLSQIVPGQSSRIIGRPNTFTSLDNASRDNLTANDKRLNVIKRYLAYSSKRRLDYFTSKSSSPDNLTAIEEGPNITAVDREYSSELVRGKELRDAVHTIAEWRKEARENGKFLQEILSQNYYHSDSKKVLSLFFLGGNSTFPHLQKLIKTPLKNNYDIDKDLIVFIHIQKTGGMYLNERLRTNLKLDFPCNCKKLVPCGCLNKHQRMWMYTSAFSGWTCGLHADWTQMHSCIPQLADKVDKEHRERRYFYMTQLRDPLDRYISEWNHQSRGGHWQNSFYMCAGKHVEWGNVRPCFLTDNWRGVSLDEFMKCKYNLATNRMARMLADLESSDCYKHFHEERYKSIRAPQWVSSAKANLRSMEYFGIMEEPEKSDKLFHKVYSLEFKSKSVGKTTGSLQSRVTKQQFLRLIQLTELDIHIYLFAQDLLNQRINN